MVYTEVIENARVEPPLKCEDLAPAQGIDQVGTRRRKKRLAAATQPSGLVAQQPQLYAGAKPGRAADGAGRRRR